MEATQALEVKRPQSAVHLVARDPAEMKTVGESE